MIPFLDLQKVNAPYEEAFLKQFDHFLKSGTYILGKAVDEFEEEFSNYCGSKYAIGTGNGLDALRLIFEGLKLQGKLEAGDGILVAANSYIATILSIIHSGLKPVFVEVDEYFFNIDIEKTEIPDNSVKAVLTTHLYGQLGAIQEISAFAKKHNLLLLEDASQAHGAELNGIKAGSFGIAAAFSCYPTKNLGALGDAGVIITSDLDLAKIIKKLRNYGKTSIFENEYTGFNSRLDPLQALFLSQKLKDLDAQNSLRRTIAMRYFDEIKNDNIKPPYWNFSENHVFYVYVVRVNNRAHFLSYLEACGVGFAVHYPIPPYKQKALNNYNHLKFPVTENLATTCVSIPLNSALSEHDISTIIAVLNAYHV